MLNDVVRTRAPSPTRAAATSTRWRELRRAVLWHRRLIAAGLAALAVALTIASLEPPQADTVAVLSAARDIAGGHLVTESDLVMRALPKSVVPDGALLDPATAIGRLVAGPVRRGEPLTDVRLVGPSLVAAFGVGVVATPVRVQDAGALSLLHAGDHIDVLATPAASDGASALAVVVALNVSVVAVPAQLGASAYDEGGLVILATTSEQARALATAAGADRLSIVVRAP